MNNKIAPDEKTLQVEEITAKAGSGMAALLINILLLLVSIAAVVLSSIMLAKGSPIALAVTIMVVSLVYMCIVSPILFAGLKVLRPNEAYVLTLFGKYFGTLKGEGFFFVNPFVTAVNTVSKNHVISTTEVPGLKSSNGANVSVPVPRSKKISLKAMTLSNDKQKINDLLGNPIVIGIVVIWRVVNTAKAVFNVDNYEEFLSIQSDSALRNIVRLYPYDVAGDDNEKTLRGSSQEIAEKIRTEIQEKVNIAGLEIVEARITHLSYAPEIAAAMLQRQQASAVIDARQMIVEGAVGMVEMALTKLNENDIVHLDEERKAAMVSNLLVVLCANREPQPIVNSGSLY
jgi:regulator of protease activity HflC (stomatin/prohibitin superfamily)